MRILTLSIGLLFFFLFRRDVTVKYHLEGISDDIFISSLQKWNFRGVTWKRVDHKNDANLLVKKTPTLRFENVNGEANHKEIHINANRKFSDKALENLLAHEIGHYLFLPHNSKNSIMNSSIPLHCREVSDEDKKVSLLKLRILFSKIAGSI
jgi:hypothetical protein